MLPEVARQLGVLAVDDEPKAEQPMPLERLGNTGKKALGTAARSQTMADDEPRVTGESTKWGGGFPSSHPGVGNGPVDLREHAEEATEIGAALQQPHPCAEVALQQADKSVSRGVRDAEQFGSVLRHEPAAPLGGRDGLVDARETRVNVEKNCSAELEVRGFVGDRHRAFAFANRVRFVSGVSSRKRW